MKISATATSDVTCGSRTNIRKKVRARSFVFRTWARKSAKRSWGIVAMRKIPSVFSRAFQKYESWMRVVKFWSPMKFQVGSSSVRSVIATYAV